MASIQKTATIIKRRNDIFPSIVPFVMTSSISVQVECIGENKVNYEFVSSGNTGTIDAGTTKNLVSNSDPTNDTINFEFLGAAKIVITYVEGAGSGSGATNNLLSKKRPDGYLLDVTAGAQPLPSYDFRISDFSLVFDTTVFTGTINYDFFLNEPLITRIEDLINTINESQSLVVAHKYSDTQILFSDGVLLAENLSSFNLYTGFSTSIMNSFSFLAGEPYTSSLDCINENVSKINQAVTFLFKQVDFQLILVQAGDNPVVFRTSHFKYMSFIVLQGTATLEYKRDNEFGYTLLATYPIQSFRGDMIGEQIEIGQFINGKVQLTINPGGIARIKFYNSLL